MLFLASWAGPVQSFAGVSLFVCLFITTNRISRTCRILCLEKKIEKTENKSI